MNNNETEPDLHVTNYEEIPLPESTQARIRGGTKYIRGMWTFHFDRPASKWRGYFNAVARAVKNLVLDFLIRLRYSVTQHISERISLMAESIKSTEEKSVKQQVNKESSDWKKLGNGIIGISMLFVAGSIVASTVIIINGTEGLTTRLIVAPMAIYAVIILVSKFLANNNQGKK